jgi:general stress protein YciG
VLEYGNSFAVIPYLVPPVSLDVSIISGDINPSSVAPRLQWMGSLTDRGEAPHQDPGTGRRNNVAKEDRGFASMDRAKQRDIASKGGKAAHQKGTAHEWTSEEARDAGRKGGIASHQRRREQMGGAEPEQMRAYESTGSPSSSMPSDE